MSIWTASPNFVGRTKGVVFLLDLSIVDVVPRSNIGSWLEDDIEKLGWLVSCICLIMLVTFRNPNLL